MTRLAKFRHGSEAGFTLTELLVVMTLMGIIASAVTSTVVSTLRVEEVERALQDVIDDGRIAMTDIRRELRSARRVYQESDAAHLHFWVDQNQDSLVQPTEQICYAVEEIATSPARYEVARYTDVAIGACDTTSAVVTGPDGTRRTLARTLVDPQPFVAYAPVPAGITDPPTREVTIRFDLETLSPRGPGVTTVEGAVRLRNVP